VVEHRLHTAGVTGSNPVLPTRNTVKPACCDKAGFFRFSSFLIFLLHTVSATASSAQRRFDLLIFDWDGTLMDSAGVIAACIQSASRDMQLPVPSREDASHVIGLGLREALEMLFPALPEALHPDLANHYRRHFLSQDAEIPLFDGARELIAELHAGGHLLAVATGKARRGLDRAFEHSGLAPYFHASRTADETFSKPHPMMLEQLLDELMVAPERALMIGDTSHDLDMARNAGMASLAAGFGAHPPESLAAYGPLAVCRSFSELATWLRQNA
jgi:phosphoglycolate phosphatase